MAEAGPARGFFSFVVSLASLFHLVNGTHRQGSHFSFLQNTGPPDDLVLKQKKEKQLKKMEREREKGKLKL